MKQEQLLIWSYGIENLPKGVFETRFFNIYDTYDNIKHRFKNEKRWMFIAPGGSYNYTIYEQELPTNLYLVCNKKINNIQFDYCDATNSCELKIVSDRLLHFIQKNGLIKGYDITSIKLVNKKNEILTDKKYYGLRFKYFDNDLFIHNNDLKINSCGNNIFTLYPNMRLKETAKNRAFFVMKGVEYSKTLIFKSSIINEILENFYMPEIYTTSDYATIWWDRQKYPYGNNLQITPAKLFRK